MHAAARHRWRCQHAGNPGVGRVGIRHDEHGAGRLIGILRLQDDGRGACGGKILPVPGVGQETDRARGGVPEGSHRADLDTGITAQTGTKPFGQNSESDTHSPAALARRYAKPLLAALRRGAAAPLVRRRPNRTPPPGPVPPPGVVARLKEVRAKVADQLELEPGLLCSSQVLKTIARSRPDDRSGLLAAGLRSWQADQLGPELLAALAE